MNRQAYSRDTGTMELKSVMNDCQETKLFPAHCYSANVGTARLDKPQLHMIASCSGCDWTRSRCRSQRAISLDRVKTTKIASRHVTARTSIWKFDFGLTDSEPMSDGDRSYATGQCTPTTPRGRLPSFGYQRHGGPWCRVRARQSSLTPPKPPMVEI
jgi:hypothetical protein